MVLLSDPTILRSHNKTEQVVLLRERIIAVASLLVARGLVASAPPSISVKRLSAILCPRARSGMLCLWASDCPPSTKMNVKGEGRVWESLEKRSR